MTIYWICFLLLILNIVSGDVRPDCYCGMANIHFQKRIIGGVNTSPHEYPWVAALFSSDKEIYCGGSVITTRHILSAGHCVYYTNPYTLHAKLGMHDRILYDGERYDFSRILLHPGFKALPSHDVSDVAILETDRPIQFSYKVQPICLPEFDNTNYDNVRATVAGWGRMWSGGINSKVLLETKVTVQPANVCRKTRIGHLLDPVTMICGYRKNADACQGDSGGPLFFNTGGNRHEQIGVVSFGIGCGSENAPGIYSSITAHLPWIKQVAAGADTCLDRNNVRS